MVFVRGVGERRSGSTMNALKGEIPAPQFSDLDVRVSHLPASPNSSISFNYFIMLTNVLLIRRITRASRNPRRPSQDNINSQLFVITSSFSLLMHERKRSSGSSAKYTFLRSI